MAEQTKAAVAAQPASQPKQKLMRFRVMAGKHTDENSKVHGPGDIVTTRIDLKERFGAKFERVYGEEETDPDDLSDMPIARLKEIAAERMIDLKGVTRKEDVLTIIRASRLLAGV